MDRIPCSDFKQIQHSQESQANFYKDPYGYGFKFKDFINVIFDY